MSTTSNIPEFETGLEDLQEHLPSWWRSQDSSSELYKVLDAFGLLLDTINTIWEQPYLDAVIDTASEQGLRRNFAFAWGLLNERLPTVAPQLAAYIKARAAEDGSIQSLINTLTALINNPANAGGPVLTFPAGGGGLTFPTDGSGLVLYEYTTQPTPALTFAADGTGLTFPADGSGLVLSSYAPVQFLPNYSTYTLTVKVLAFLSFDRQAFARAVARFVPPDWLPAVIQEVTGF